MPDKSGPPPQDQFTRGELDRVIKDLLPLYLNHVTKPRDTETVVEIWKRLPEVFSELAKAAAEIQRLYALLESLTHKHLPMAGAPGAAAYCRTCSMFGAQVPWPCEIYNELSRHLPER